MIIPPDQLDPDTLTALIEDFVTRAGAVHGHDDTSMEQMISSVRAQLKARAAEIVFDEAEETWTIVRRDHPSSTR